MKLARVAWKELVHRRSSLISGLVAITLGIAVMVGIRSVTLASEHAVAVQLDSLGANVLVLPQGASVDDYHTADIDAPTFPEEYVERAVTSGLLGVESISPKLTRRVRIDDVSIVLTGVLPDDEVATKPVWLLDSDAAAEEHACAGSSGSCADPRLQRKPIDKLGRADCLVGAGAAERLGTTVGSQVTVQGSDFRVIAVLDSTGTVDDDRLFMHLHVMQSLLGVGRNISAIEIMGCCSVVSDGMLSELRNILPDTRVTSISQIVSTQVETNRLMQRLSWGVLLIVLVVGGLSIGNYMWANVNQRRREIGILRMLGARRGSILGALMAKAVFLGLLGGVLGYVIGTAAVVGLGPSVLNLEVSALPSWMLISVALATLIAVLGSLLPAWLAARFDPSSNMQEV